MERPPKGSAARERLPLAAFPTRTGWTLGGMTALVFVVSRTTASGWAMMLVALTSAALFWGCVAPALHLRALRVVRCDARTVWVAGRPGELALWLPASLRGACVRTRRPESAWLRVDAPGRGLIVVRFPARGVFEFVDVEVRCAAPLGLVRWTARRRLPLPANVEVGPRPADVHLPASLVARGPAPDGSGWRRTGPEPVGSVREYVAGDPARLVHWPATARLGELAVKRVEEPRVPGVVIVVDLRGSPSAVEAAAERAAGYATAALEAGAPVRLVTAERLGVVDGPVAGADDVARRLARAIGGPVHPPDAPAGSLVVVTAGEGPAEERVPEGDAAG